MTLLTKNHGKIVSSLLLALMVFGIALVYATTESGYNNDNNLLTSISETRFAENGYKAHVILAPAVTGAYANENGYKLDLTINPTGIGGKLTENSIQLDLIPAETFPEFVNVAMINAVAPSTAIVGQTCNVKVTVANEGDFTETFNVTLYGKMLYGNEWPIYTFTGVTLPPESTTTLNISLGFDTGFYTLKAYAWPVSTETKTLDNTYPGVTVLVAPIARFRPWSWVHPIPI